MDNFPLIRDNGVWFSRPAVVMLAQSEKQQIQADNSFLLFQKQYLHGFMYLHCGEVLDRKAALNAAVCAETQICELSE